MSRIKARFEALKARNKCGFSAFITAGDPDLQTCAEILKGLPKAGVDMIELGMPFSDPMADGVAIQAANIRAFASGVTTAKIFDLLRDFRKHDNETPVTLMGYYNPILHYGVEKFARDAAAAGADGLLVVDVPPEEDRELRPQARAAGIDFIRLVTPTTDAKRLPTVLDNASGFLYYVSVAGITGGKKADAAPVEAALKELRKHTQLPVMVGFGITTPEEGGAIAGFADAVVVGSAIVSRIASNLDAAGKAKPDLTKDVLGFVSALACAAHKE